MNIVAQNIERDKAHQKGMSAEEFEQFTTYFYKLNDVSRVVPALSYFFKNEQLPHAIENGRNGPLTYFFYRLAQLHPDLWDQYAQLFDQAGHDQRLILIWIFSLEKGDTVDRQLISWRNDDKLREEHEEINEMLQTDDRGINILDIEHATSAADLDRLWTEFIVTGNIAAIRKIIG